MSKNGEDSLPYRVTLHVSPFSFHLGGREPDPYIPDRFRPFVENMYSYYPLDALIAISELLWDVGEPWEKHRMRLEEQALHAIITKQLESPDKHPPYRCRPYVYFAWFRRKHAIKGAEWTKILLDAFEKADRTRHRPQTPYIPRNKDVEIIKAIGKQGGLTAPKISQKTGIPLNGELKARLSTLRRHRVFLPEGKKGTGYILNPEYHSWVDYAEARE
ncbi:MAG: hypothetical protein IT366_09015 [Candidatus Hydrogenedentes bacterium]|nr:hypothetical protein [Candidatus Hydrogenedentota bacterium]